VLGFYNITTLFQTNAITFKMQSLFNLPPSIQTDILIVFLILHWLIL